MLCQEERNLTHFTFTVNSVNNAATATRIAIHTTAMMYCNTQLLHLMLYAQLLNMQHVIILML